MIRHFCESGRSMPTLAALTLLTVNYGISPVYAADLWGATKALEQFEKGKKAGLATKSHDAPADAPQEGWPAELENYQKAVTAMSPEEAANTWLALFDALLTLKADDLEHISEAQLLGTYEGSPLEPVIALLRALPPPTAWEALATAIDKREVPKKAPTRVKIAGQTLRVLSGKLRNDAAAQKKALGDLKKLGEGIAEEDEYFGQQTTQTISNLENAYLKNYGTPEMVAAAFEAALKRTETGGERQYGDFDSQQVPNLVELVGEEKARPLILRALLLKEPVSSFSGSKTRALAKTIALENIDKLTHPVWILVDDPSDTKLYEAIAAKFPKASTPDEKRLREYADRSYFRALAWQGRTDEAMKLLVASPDIAIVGGCYPTANPAEAQKLFPLLRDYVKSNEKGTKILDCMVTTGAQAGQSAEVVSFLKELAATKPEAGRALPAALLSSGQVDEAVALMRQEFSGTGLDQAQPDPVDNSNGIVISRRESTPDYIALKLVELGRLLKRPDWVNEGFAAYEKLKTKESESNYIALLASTGRVEQEEQALIQRLAKAGEEEASAAENSGSDSTVAETVTQLAAFYTRQGRHEDALLMVDSCDSFNGSDLAELYSGYTGVDTDLLAETIAGALIAKGDMPRARVVLKAALKNSAGNDALYALLMKTGSDGLEAMLDELYALDAYQERPLIWKAQLLLDQGRLEEAEKTARQAVTIDPSDGEEGKGDRMRVYAVLSDILAKKGDETQSKFFKAVVRAIRLSEDADDFWQAGLLTKAIAMYEEGLTQFADAYCMHSRLALRAAELGQMDLAREHYLRAFELMPDSFGRVESHCFGCEGVFQEGPGRDIASEVFAELVKKNPEKPQVQYLMGYLQEAKEEYRPALASLQEAVRLDPKYLNAWEKLQQISHQLNEPGEKVDAMILAIWDLDPQGKHVSADLENVANWRLLWESSVKHLAAWPAPAKDIYPLAASARRQAMIQDQIKQVRAAGMDGSYLEMALHHDDTSIPTSPGQVITTTQYSQAVQNLLEGALRQP